MLRRKNQLSVDENICARVCVGWCFSKYGSMCVFAWDSKVCLCVCVCACESELLHRRGELGKEGVASEEGQRERVAAHREGGDLRFV